MSIIVSFHVKCHTYCNFLRLYGAGAQPVVPKLYRPISYPVGRGTPMLNSKVSWDHSQRFVVPKLGTDCKCFHISALAN